MSREQLTFTGIRSGDAECFCWDGVHLENRRTGENESLRRVYPDDLMNRLKVEEGKFYTFTIIAEEKA